MIDKNDCMLATPQREFQSQPEGATDSLANAARMVRGKPPIMTVEEGEKILANNKKKEKRRKETKK
jgi:hypothetical protein